MNVRARLPICVLLLLLLSAATRFAVAEATSVPASAGNSTNRYEERNCIVLLPAGPVHLRFKLSFEGQALTAARERLLDDTLHRLDLDADGRLSERESAASGLLRRAEQPGLAQLLGGVAPPGVDRAALAARFDRLAGDTVSYRQDRAVRAPDELLLAPLDADDSGTIDAAEIEAAAERLGERDLDGDDCVTYEELLPAPPPTTTLGVDAVAEMMTAATVRRPGMSELLRDFRDPLLPRRLVMKYDRNGDGRLGPVELAWPEERLAALDQNGDRVLTERELAGLPQQPADVEIAVELRPGEGQPHLTASAPGGAPNNATAAHLQRVSSPQAEFSVSHRPQEPFEVVLAAARTRFNRLDTDGSGYLDRRETAEQVRFDRELFAAMDANADGKIFDDEVEQYVRETAEPAGMTCRVTLYDMGAGLFGVCDENGDGRISQRELRSVADRLRRRQHEVGKLTANAGPRHYHLELSRGRRQVFGPVDPDAPPTPTFLARVAVGPTWFQRMDRNNDGDLSWNEFLGPREDFHRLDADGDSLIDPVEASAAHE